MITIANYKEKTAGMQLTGTLADGHSFLTEFGDLYSDDADIKEAIDLYLEQLNQNQPEPVVEKKTKPEPPLTCPPVDANGKRRIDADGLNLLADCIKNEPDTKASNTDSAGNYTPQRKKLHNSIVARFKEQKPCRSKKPIAVLTGGPPGSGKTTFLKKFAPWLTGNQVFHIDADETRAKLPEYKGWNADNTQAETSDIVKRMLVEIGEPCEFDVVYDGTMNKAKNYMPLIDQLKKLGYEVYVIYITVPYEVSIERAMGRYQRSGRYVPKFVIDEVFANGTDAFEKVAKAADGYIKVDGISQEIIERGGKPIPENRDFTNKKTAKPKAPKPETLTATLKSTAGKVRQNMSEAEVLHLARQVNEARKLSAQASDNSRTSKRRLSPTPENLLRWMRNPGNFDLIGVDTLEGKNYEPTANYKREISKQKLFNLFKINV